MTSSTFQAVTDAVLECFHAVRAEFNRGSLSPDGWRTGRGAVRENSSPPSVVWVRGSGTIESPLSSEVFEQNGQRFPVRYTKRQLVHAFIWGEDDDDTEQMHDEVLEAVSRALGQFYQPGDYRWVSQEVDGFSWLYAGVELVIQDFVWPLVVPGAAENLVVIESEEETGILRSSVWTPS